MVNNPSKALLMFMFLCVAILGGCATTSATLDAQPAINYFQNKYPDIDFTQAAPFESIYPLNFERTWAIVINTLQEMEEEIYIMDKKVGFISTKKKKFNTLTFLETAQGKSTLKYEYKIMVTPMNRGCMVKVSVPFWSAKAFLVQKMVNFPDGPNTLQHIFFRTLNNKMKYKQAIIAQKSHSSGIDKPEDKLGETSTYGKEHQRNNKSEAKSTSYKGGNYYIVQPGDTLSDISMKTFGSCRYWRKIADHNNITDPYNLDVGQRILIPADFTLQSTYTFPEKDSSSNLSALNASSEETVTIESKIPNQQKKNQNLFAAEQQEQLDYNKKYDEETTQIASLPQQKEEQKGWLRIVSDTPAKIREKPNPFSKVATTLPQGTRLPWFEKDGAWYKITTTKVEGYIYEEFVKKD